MCMPDTTVTFTRTPAAVGRSTTTEAGILSISPSQTGKGQKTLSKRREAKIPSSERRQRRATTTAPARATLTDQARVAITGLAEVRLRKCKTCNTRLRIGSVVGKRANAFKISNAAAVIDSEAVVAVVSAVEEAVG